jgi:dTDP-4-dehydrorhamnose 3,5-epimerase
MGWQIRRADPPRADILMRILPTELAGLFVVETEKHEDERGYFARTFCAEEFAAAGLGTSYPQCNTSFNRSRGTLRGLHYQDAPSPEARLVRCTRGTIFDVALDLRPNSPTWCRWFGTILSAANATMLFIPAGFAHGFQTLEDATEVFYQMSESYHGDLARGVRWDDPAFAIEWPIPSPTLSPRDAQYPDFAA